MRAQTISPFERGLLAYVGRVRESLSVGAYERRFRGRSDAIYRERKNGSPRRLKPDYHSSANDFRKDTCNPVIRFDEGALWYFGSQPHPLPENLHHLAAGGRGHRVSNNADGIHALEQWLRSAWAARIHAVPRNPDLDAAPTPGRLTVA